MNNELKPLSPFKDFCVKFLGYIPSSYDECFTYLECLEYTYTYLKNQVVPSVNAQNEVIQEMKDYMDHYFDNLDVTEEINNKLDQMALDGTLTNLIKNYVDPLYEGYTEAINERMDNLEDDVEETLTTFQESVNENLTNLTANQNTLSERMDSFTNLEEGSTTGDAELIDGRTSFDSLTYSNIGDNIRNSDEKINQRVNEYINTDILKNAIYTTGVLDGSGGVNTSATSYKTTDYIDITAGVNYYFKTCRFICWYNDTTLVSYVNISSSYARDIVVTAPSGANKCRCSFANDYSNMITMNVVSDDFTTKGKDKIKDAIGKRNNMIYGLTPVEGKMFRNGVEETAASYDYYKNIKVKANHTYTVYPRVRFVGFFDGEYTHTYTSDFTISGSSSVGAQSFTPTSDGYVNVTVYAADDSNGLCKMVDTTTSDKQYPVDARVVEDTFCLNDTSIKYIEDNLSYKKINGTKIYNFGDSIGAGDGNGGIGYAEMLQSSYGTVSTDYAVGGATLSKLTGQTMNCILNQIDNASNTAPDIILLEGGANDYTQYRVTGNMTNEFNFDHSNFDTETYCGALEEALYKLTNKYQGVPIIWIYTHRENTRTEKTNGTVTVNFTDMHDKSLQICKKWSIPVVDIYNESGLNTMLDYYKNTYTYNSDGTHPNQLGYEKWYMPYIRSKIIEVLNK